MMADTSSGPTISLSLLSHVVRGAATMIGTVAALTAGWVGIGLPIPATREYVDGKISVLQAADIKTVEAVRQVQVDLLVNRRDQTEADIFTQEQTIKKEPSNYDAVRRLRSLQDQLMEINDRIAYLRKIGN